MIDLNNIPDQALRKIPQFSKPFRLNQAQLLRTKSAGSSLTMRLNIST